ncbi:MAG: PQQ-binding-like beta-propeller repeat protein, partial [Planctomycetota bacterium]
MTNQTQDLHDETTGRRRHVAPYPPLRLWVFWLLCLAGIVSIRLVDFFEPAVVTIVTLIFTLLALAGFLAWWCFRSPFPAFVRWLPPVLLLVTASVIPIRYELYRTTGSLIPQFVRRGKTPDRLIEATPTVETTLSVDIATTSPTDFARFLGPDGNSRVLTINLNPDWKANPPLELWRRQVGAGWSGFSVVNGFAFTMEQRGDDELVVCYELETGRPCWSHGVEARHATVFGALGPRSTPTIADGKVYAMGATGILRCLDGATGEPVWQRDLFADYNMDETTAEKAVAWGRSNSPLVFNGRLYIPIGGPRDGSCVSLLCLNAESGETIWEGGDYQASYASPVLMNLAGEEQIVMVNEGFVTGHELETGEILWEHEWSGRSDMNANVSQPHQVGDDSVFLSKGYAKGAELITLIPDDEDLWEVEVVWAKRVMKTKFSNAAIKDGYAYGLDDGTLSCVSVETDQEYLAVFVQSLFPLSLAGFDANTTQCAIV